MSLTVLFNQATSFSVVLTETIPLSESLVSKYTAKPALSESVPLTEVLTKSQLQAHPGLAEAVLLTEKLVASSGIRGGGGIPGTPLSSNPGDNAGNELISEAGDAPPPLSSNPGDTSGNLSNP